MIRHYTAEPVDAAIVEDLLAAAIRAPSPHHRQPWRFAIVLGEARMRLARTMGAQLRADLLADGVSPSVIEQDVMRSYQRITSAPVGIVACLSMQEMDTYPDARRNQAERWMAGQAVAAAIQNLLLRATELGLGACWMCAPLFCAQAVRDILRLPPDWEPQALITLGHPADAGKDRPRKPLKEVTQMVDE